MKNVPSDSLYIKKLQVYDRNIFEHIYLKKNNKFISLKTEKVNSDIREEELIKLILSGYEFGKIDVEDIKLVANRFAVKSNYDPNLTLQKSPDAVNTNNISYITINPYSKTIDKFNYLIKNIGEIERIRRAMEGSTELKGVISYDSDGTMQYIKTNFNYDTKDEKIDVYFTRRLKKLQLEKKKKGLFSR